MIGEDVLSIFLIWKGLYEDIKDEIAIHAPWACETNAFGNECKKHELVLNLRRQIRREAPHGN